MAVRIAAASFMVALGAYASPFPEVAGTGTSTAGPSAVAIAVGRAKRDALARFLERYLTPRALAGAEASLEAHVLERADQFLRSHRVVSIDRTGATTRAEIRGRVSVGALRGALAQEVEPFTIVLAVRGYRGERDVGAREPGTRLARELLAARPGVRVVDPAEIEALRKVGAIPSGGDGAELGLRTLSDLVCSGRIDLELQDTPFDGLFLGRARATLRLLRTATAEVVAALDVPFTDDRLCREAEAYARAGDGVYRGTGKALREAIEKLRRRGKGEDVRLDAVLEPIYTSCFLSYRDRPLGHVTVINEGDRDLEGCSLELAFEGRSSLLAEPCTAPVAAVPAGGRVEAGIRPKLSGEILGVRDPELAATIRLVRAGGTIAVLRRAIFVYDAHTFTWEIPERVAVFVQPQDPAVEAFVRGLWPQVAARTGRGFPPRNIAAASTLLSALGAMGLAYRPDPLTPIAELADRTVKDRVQYPHETLVGRTGDCDDLSVLVCAVLEAAGVPSAFVVGESHVLAMLDTGLRAQELETAPLDPATAVLWKGRIWIPIEATALGRPGAGFGKLWEAAQPRCAWIGSDRAAKVAIREAWRSYQGVTAPADEVTADWIRRAPWGAGTVTARIEEACERVRDGFRRALQARVEAARAGGRDPAEKARAIGTVYARAGLLDEARTHFERSLAARESFETHYNLGICLTLSAKGPGDLAGAVRHLRSAVSLLPPDDLPGRAETLLRLAVAQRLRGDREGEGEALRLARAIDPSLGERYRSLVAAEGAKASAHLGSDEVRAFLRVGLR